SHDDLQLFFSPMAGYTLIYLNLQSPNVPFFQDVQVRKALLMGLNRQQLIDNVLYGAGLVAHSPMLPQTWAYHDKVFQYKYNVEAARQLLEEAGWRDEDGDGIRERDGQRLSFILLGPDHELDVALLRSIAAAWREIGVEAVPQPVAVAGLAADFLAAHNYDAALVTWELSGDPDPYPLWHSTQIATGQNYAGWSNGEADEIMEQARITADMGRRIQLYRRFQEIFAQELPALLLYHPVYVYGVRDKVKGVQVGCLNQPADRFRTFADWYILTRRVAPGGL
ncbi:MAG TPA: hypothetical protein EYH31_05880, partial [Anaerolineae bacterium]|nr:hypothetical protein [Anaerolineae bacterium]